MRVLLFGGEALALGRGSVEVRVPAGATVADVRAVLASTHPALAGAHVRIAVNHAFAGEQRRIDPGDEVAVIGLVSGG